MVDNIRERMDKDRFFQGGVGDSALSRRRGSKRSSRQVTAPPGDEFRQAFRTARLFDQATKEDAARYEPSMEAIIHVAGVMNVTPEQAIDYILAYRHKIGTDLLLADKALLTFVHESEAGTRLRAALRL